MKNFLPRLRRKSKVYEPVRTEVINIIGLGSSVYDWVTFNYREFPLDDEQTWTINAGARLYHHDIVWDMHTPEWIAADPSLERVVRRREWMKTHDKPIIMPYHIPEIPTSLTFPLKKVMEATNSNFFSGGLGYPLATAYMLKPKTLRLYGCDFSYSRDFNTHNEPGLQCACYWIGRIKESGIRIEITPNTHFLDMNKRSQGYLYGYHEPATWEFNKEGVGTFTGPDYVNNRKLSRTKPGTTPEGPKLGGKSPSDS